MQFLENIKIKIGKYLLKSSLEKREPMSAVPNFDSIKEIAILYQADDTKKEAEVNKLAQHLREQGKKVLLMGFVNQKQLPENYKFQISQEYFWKESLSLFLLPQKEKVANFINKPFDLLINLYSEFSLPMVAVSAYSKAKNRIGAHFPESESYNDILIDGQFKNLFELGLQMEHYLKIVNSKS
jgi:hypothetical protein